MLRLVGIAGDRPLPSSRASNRSWPSRPRFRARRRQPRHQPPGAAARGISRASRSRRCHRPGNRRRHRRRGRPVTGQPTASSPSNARAPAGKELAANPFSPHTASANHTSSWNIFASPSQVKSTTSSLKKSTATNPTAPRSRTRHPRRRPGAAARRRARRPPRRQTGRRRRR